MRWINCRTLILAAYLMTLPLLIDDDKRGRIVNACLADAVKYCGVSASEEELVRCMKAHRSQLSPACLREYGR